MLWLKALTALLTAAGALASYLRERRLIDAAGEAAVARTVAGSLARYVDMVNENETLREEVRRRNAAVPRGRSLPDDGWRRD